MAITYCKVWQPKEPIHIDTPFLVHNTVRSEMTHAQEISLDHDFPPKNLVKDMLESSKR